MAVLTGVGRLLAAKVCPSGSRIEASSRRLGVTFGSGQDVAAVKVAVGRRAVGKGLTIC